jgi:hypothetical protein
LLCFAFNRRNITFRDGHIHAKVLVNPIFGILVDISGGARNSMSSPFLSSDSNGIACHAWNAGIQTLRIGASVRIDPENCTLFCWEGQCNKSNINKSAR